MLGTIWFEHFIWFDFNFYKRNTPTTTTGGLRSAIKKSTEWTYIEAPYAVIKAGSDEFAGEVKDLGYSWFDFSEAGLTSPDVVPVEGDKDNNYDYYNEIVGPQMSYSLGRIDAIVRSQGPFHGICGFSQVLLFPIDILLY